jgi:hypothetical protein
MLKIKNNNNTNFKQDVKTFAGMETKKVQAVVEAKMGSKKMSPSQTTKFFYPKNGLYGLL